MDYLSIGGIPLSYSIVADSDDIVGVSNDAIVTGMNTGGAAIDINTGGGTSRIVCDVISNPTIYLKYYSGSDGSMSNAIVRGYAGGIPQFVALDTTKPVYFAYSFTIPADQYLGVRTRRYTVSQWNVTDYVTGELLGTIVPSIPSSPSNGQIDKSVWDNFYGFQFTSDVRITAVSTYYDNPGAMAIRKYSYLPWVSEVSA